MKPGDIVLIRFPQADLQAGKLRPALVVAIAPGRHADLLLALISSRTYQSVPQFDELIDPADPDYATSGLKAPSVIRLARLASVEASTINARLGHISAQRLRGITKRLADLVAHIEKAGAIPKELRPPQNPLAEPLECPAVTL